MDNFPRRHPMDRGQPDHHSPPRKAVMAAAPAADKFEDPRQNPQQDFADVRIPPTLSDVLSDLCSVVGDLVFSAAELSDQLAPVLHCADNDAAVRADAYIMAEGDAGALRVIAAIINDAVAVRAQLRDIAQRLALADPRAGMPTRD